MKRQIYQNLIDWSRKKDAKPLLLLGARQVGKTYIIDKFIHENFE